MFSVHGSRPKSYIELFDAMDAEEVYDEKAFLLKYHDAPFAKFIAASKSFLKKVILKAMRVYHEDRFSKSEVFAHISNYHFLFEKGLYDEAAKELRKARKLAEARELDLMRLEINALETKYEIERSSRVKVLHSRIQPLQEDQKRVLDRIQLEYLFVNTYHHAMVEYREGDLGGVRQQLETLLGSINLSSVLDSPEQFSFEVRLYCMMILSLAAKARGNKEEFRLTYQKIIDLFHAEKRYHGEDLKRYLKAVSNYLSSCQFAGVYSEFPPLLDQLRENLGQRSSRDEEGELLQSIYLFSGLLHMNKSEWKAATQIPPQVRNLFLEHGGKVNKAREVALSFNCMLIWFFNESWAKMKPWMDHLLDLRSAGFKQSIISGAIILEIIYFYEKEELELLDYLNKAAKRKVIHQGYKKLLSMLRKVVNGPTLDRPKRIGAIAEFLLDQLANPVPEVSTVGFVEMYYWARSRENGISIIEAERKFHLSEGSVNPTSPHIPED